MAKNQHFFDFSMTLGVEGEYADLEKGMYAFYFMIFLKVDFPSNCDYNIGPFLINVFAILDRFSSRMILKILFIFS